jgi:putative copper export protein/mono/diheme cytochrome c family protein
VDRWHAVLVLLRGCDLLALAWLFGSLVSLALVAPVGLREAGAAAAPARGRLVSFARWSDAVALLVGAVWTVLQAATIAGSTSVGGAVGALATVLYDTRFGHLQALCFTLLIALFPLLGGRQWRLPAALALAGMALAMQGGIGHAGAAGGATGASLLLFEALHLLAAGAWLGGLPPLFLLVGSLPPRAAAAVCRSFSAVGLSAVVLIAGTASVQYWQWIGDLGGLLGTRYGRIALIKLGLFLLLLLLAGINRFVLTERLLADGDADPRRLLRGSIVVEAILGGLVIMAAAFLASGTPATHETPIWPFSWRPSLDGLSDPYRRAQLLSSLLPSAIAGVVMAIMAIVRFRRPVFWLSLTLLGVLAGLASPKLASLLTIDAYPTTFANSPTEFADSSIVRGAALFAANCVQCHGAGGQGDGPAAKSLPVPPADLTAAHFRAHTEGDLFWFISHGMNAPTGAATMPAFGNKLPNDDRWALIDFLRAHNAGESVRTTGGWIAPTPLPQFDAICADGSVVDLDDLRGRLLRIVANPEGLPSPPPAPDGTDVATIILSLDRKAKPVGAACVTIEPAAWNAFSILLGVAPDALAETQALADPDGWLRARWRPGDPDDWNDPQTLQTVIHAIVTHPLVVGSGGGHAHHH